MALLCARRDVSTWAEEDAVRFWLGDGNNTDAMLALRAACGTADGRCVLRQLLEPEGTPPPPNPPSPRPPRQPPALLVNGASPTACVAAPLRHTISEDTLQYLLLLRRRAWPPLCVVDHEKLAEHTLVRSTHVHLEEQDLNQRDRQLKERWRALNSTEESLQAAMKAEAPASSHARMRTLHSRTQRTHTHTAYPHARSVPTRTQCSHAHLAHTACSLHDARVRAVALVYAYALRLFACLNRSS